MVRPIEVKLRNGATEALAKGNHAKALRYYKKLEELRPEDATWPRKSADIYRSLGESTKAIESYARASAVYAESGFTGKAIAVCHLILRLNPDNQDARKHIDELNGNVTSPLGHLSRTPAATIAAPVQGLPNSDQRTESSTHTSRKFARRSTGIMEALQSKTSKQQLPSIETTQGVLRNTTLLVALSDPELNSLVEHVKAIDLEAGHSIFVEGDSGMTIYIVRRGKMAAFQGKQPVQLAQFGQGEFFGEIELFTHQPRAATLTALVDTKLLAIEKQSIIELTAAHPQVLSVLGKSLRERLVNNLIKTNPLFSQFVGSDREKLISRFIFLEIRPGISVLKEGENAPGLFVVMSGRLKVVRMDESGPAAPELGRGDIFGALSLLAKTGASATITTVTKCLVLKLPAAAFREVIATNPWVLSFVADLAAKRHFNA